MAFFSDPDGKFYLGILYLENNEKYSGNFIGLSNRKFKLINACNEKLIKIVSTLLVLILALSIGRKILGLNEETDILFGIAGAIVCAISVLYFAIGPIILSRNKQYLDKKRIQCLPAESARLYLLILICSLCILFDTILSGFLNIFSTGLILFFTVVPLAASSAFAYLYYRNKIT